MAATGAESKKFVALTVAPAGVLYGQKQSIPDIFSGKPHGLFGHEKTPVFLGNTGVFDSRGDKTAIELFVGGVRSWEAVLRRESS